MYIKLSISPDIVQVYYICYFITYFKICTFYLYYIWRNMIKYHILVLLSKKSDKKVQTSDTLGKCAKSVHSTANFCTF